MLPYLIVSTEQQARLAGIVQKGGAGEQAQRRAARIAVF